jgi:hypothetical protein
MKKPTKIISKYSRPTIIQNVEASGEIFDYDDYFFSEARSIFGKLHGDQVIDSLRVESGRLLKSMMYFFANLSQEVYDAINQ